MRRPDASPPAPASRTGSRSTSTAAAPGTMRLDARAASCPTTTSFAAAQPVDDPELDCSTTSCAPAPEPGEPVHAGLGRTALGLVPAGPRPRRDPRHQQLRRQRRATRSSPCTPGAAVDALTEVASNDEERRRRSARSAAATRTSPCPCTPGPSTGSPSTRRSAPADRLVRPLRLAPRAARRVRRPVRARPRGRRSRRSRGSRARSPASRRTTACARRTRCGRRGQRSAAAGRSSRRAARTTSACTSAPTRAMRVDALTPVASNDDSPACPGAFPAGARVELDVVAGPALPRRGRRAASATPRRGSPCTSRPPNDDRAAAVALPAPGAGADVDLTAAGLEAGEPRHAGVRRRRVGLVPGHAGGDRRPGGHHVRDRGVRHGRRGLQARRSVACWCRSSRATTIRAAARGGRARACAGAPRRGTRTSWRSRARARSAARRTSTWRPSRLLRRRPRRG